MKQNGTRQNICALTAAIIWGLAFVAQGMCASQIAPFTFNALRSLIAVIVLGVLVAIRRKHARTPMPKDKTYLKFLLLGGLCCGVILTAAANLQQIGIGGGTDPGKAGFITAMYIVLVPIFQLFFKKKAPFTIWASVAVAVGGLYFLCIKQGTGLTLVSSDLFVLGCAIIFSTHILSVDYFVARVDGIELSLVQFIFVLLFSTVLGWIFEGNHVYAGATVCSLSSFSAIWSCIWPLLYVGVLSSAVAYTLQIVAQKGSNPTVISILLSLESVFAALGGAVMGNPMTGREYFGCVLMFVAIVLTQLPIRVKKRSETI